MNTLDLVEAGSLTPPGPIGRGVRMVLGLLCLYALGTILHSWSWTSNHPVATLAERAVLFVAPLCAFNIVVNIGFGRSWGYRPLVVSVISVAVAAGAALLVAGGLDSPILGFPVNVWLGYFYGHLGLSFVLSSIMATPGCEMRSIPEVLGRLGGRPADEHHCPVAFLSRLDAWEQGRRRRRPPGS